MPVGTPANSSAGMVHSGLRADGDLAHRAREARGVAKPAGADEADHRRRRRHGEAAEADRLDDGGVAHVGVGVGCAEAGKVEALPASRPAR